jgi:type IV secretory pathway VirB4 component
VIAFLSVHEIRDQQERILFFQELERILTDHGKITVTEHLRDFPNFLAFNIGFFHFISRNSWIKVFEKANLIILEEIKTTPFITTFTLKKSG